MDQIVEQVSYRREVELLAARREDLTARIPGYPKLSPERRLAELIRAFVQDAPPHLDAGPETEAELLGRLTAFISQADSSFDPVRDVSLSPGGFLRPDLVEKAFSIVLEAKRAGVEGSQPWFTASAGREQLAKYMQAGGFDTGILFVIPRELGDEAHIKESPIDLGGRFGNIITVLPGPDPLEELNRALEEYRDNE